MAKRAGTEYLKGSKSKKKKLTNLNSKLSSPSTCHSTNESTSHNVTVSPEYYGIHIYTEEELSSSTGLQKQFRIYWNEKANEICSDKSIRSKLHNKAAIQGTIYTSWSLHKTHLLQLQVEEFEAQAKKVYPD